MADMNFERFNGNRRTSGDGTEARAQSLLNFAGAAVSVALVVGLAVWGYKLAVRDVNTFFVEQLLNREADYASDDS